LETCIFVERALTRQLGLDSGLGLVPFMPLGTVLLSL